MSFAPPVSRDGFFYNGDLYVEVGNLHRHKRATAAELRDLLRPNLKKSNANPQGQKDQVAHWYEAQLKHYGLPPTKDKARAKVRLLDALNAGDLTVPSPITQLENALRKEYAAADKKAKAAYKAGKEGSGDSNLQASRATSGSAAKKRKQSVEQPSLEATNNDTKPPAKKIKGNSTTTAQKPTNEEQTRQIRPLQTARRSTGSFPVSSTRSPALPEDQTSATRPRQFARRSAGSFPVSNRAKKEEKAVQPKKAVSSPGNGAKLGLINGSYTIECPTVAREWGETDLSLTLTLEGNRVWAAYDFGIWEGIMLLQSRPYEQIPSDEIPFSWCGSERDGPISFGAGNEGGMTFMGSGEIRGWMNVYGNLEFSGYREPEHGTSVRSAASMRQEWDGYNNQRYEREAAARWR